MTYTGINDILKAFFTKLKSWLQTNITKSYVGLSNCDNTADKDKNVNSAQYVSRSNNTFGASSNTLVHFEGTTDAYTQSAELTNGDDLEIRNTLIDDISTKETWYGNSTKLMTLQPTGNWSAITGADLTLHNGTITANKFSGELNGNATTATKLATARSISITDGTSTGTASSFDGSGDISLQLPSLYYGALGDLDKEYTATGLSFAQIYESFNGSSANDWASYIVCNHLNGQSYYHQMLRLPFFSDKMQIQRRVDGQLQGWNSFVLEKTDNTFSATNNFSGTLVIPTTSSTTNGAIWIG